MQLHTTFVQLHNTITQLCTTIVQLHNSQHSWKGRSWTRVSLLLWVRPFHRSVAYLCYHHHQVLVQCDSQLHVVTFCLVIHLQWSVALPKCVVLERSCTSYTEAHNRVCLSYCVQSVMCFHWRVACQKCGNSTLESTTPVLHSVQCAIGTGNHEGPMSTIIQYKVNYVSPAQQFMHAIQ